MKMRSDFVTNSSSTCYVIKNKSDSRKNIVDFFKENPDLIKQFNDEYGYDYTLEQVLKDAQKRVDEKDKDCRFRSKEQSYVQFGDEDGDSVGCILDYILRDGGESKSFSWKFDSYNR